MSQAHHPEKVDIASRAQKLESYLKEKCILQDDIPQQIKPKSLQSDIEAIFVEAEDVAREIAGKK